MYLSKENNRRIIDLIFTSPVGLELQGLGGREGIIFATTLTFNDNNQYKQP